MTLDFLERFFVEWLEQFSAAALEGVRPVMLVGYEMFQGAEEEGTEPAFFLLRPGVGAALDEVGKKALGQILRVGRGMAASAQKKIKRTPINAAELGERPVRVSGGVFCFPGREDDRPAGGTKKPIPRFDLWNDGRHTAFVPTARKKDKNYPECRPRLRASSGRARLPICEAKAQGAVQTRRQCGQNAALD